MQVLCLLMFVTQALGDISPVTASLEKDREGMQKTIDEMTKVQQVKVPKKGACHGAGCHARKHTKQAKKVSQLGRVEELRERYATLNKALNARHAQGKVAVAAKPVPVVPQASADALHVAAKAASELADSELLLKHRQHASLVAEKTEMFPHRQPESEKFHPKNHKKVTLENADVKEILETKKKNAVVRPHLVNSAKELESNWDEMEQEHNDRVRKEEEEKLNPAAEKKASLHNLVSVVHGLQDAVDKSDLKYDLLSLTEAEHCCLKGATHCCEQVEKIRADSHTESKAHKDHKEHLQKHKALLRRAPHKKHTIQ